MKQVATILILALLMASAVFAGDDTPSNECTDYGYDFMVAQWDYNSKTKVYELSDDGNAVGYATSVNGPPTKASIKWTSAPAVAGVLTKEGRWIYTHEGGTASTIEKHGNRGISHVMLCANKAEDAPEFTTLGALLALGGAGLYMYRRRRNYSK